MIDSTFNSQLPLFHGNQEYQNNQNNLRHLDYSKNKDISQNLNPKNLIQLSDSISDLIKCVHDQLLSYQKNSKPNPCYGMKTSVLEKDGSNSIPGMKFQLYGPNMGGLANENIESNPIQVAKNEEFVKNIHEYIQNAYNEG